MRYFQEGGSPEEKTYIENMSDEGDIDIESDDGNDSDTRSQNRGSNNGTQHFSQAEKRAHHNALERKRRDHIKDSFTSLKDSVPSLQGEKGASRAQILRKAAEFIQFMRRKNQSHQQNIDDLRRQNCILETQIRSLEKQKDSFTSGDSQKIHAKYESSDSETSDGEDHLVVSKPKKIKTSNCAA